MESRLTVVIPYFFRKRRQRAGSHLPTGCQAASHPVQRGRIMGMQTAEDGRSCIKAQVPYAEILDYAVDLRALTQGTGTFEMKFDHYEDVPPKMAEKIIEEAKEKEGK